MIRQSSISFCGVIEDFSVIMTHIKPLYQGDALKKEQVIATAIEVVCLFILDS